MSFSTVSQTLSLCSANYLGLADHPSVREAAAEAALRWGAGTGASRLTSGTMTIHRRLEERLAAFLGRETALLFGSGFLASTGVLAALARPGDVVFADELVMPRSSTAAGSAAPRRSSMTTSTSITWPGGSPRRRGVAR